MSQIKTTNYYQKRDVYKERLNATHSHFNMINDISSNDVPYTAPPYKEPKYGYSIINDNFGDAPLPVYGIALRVRRHYECNDTEQGCEKLKRSGKVVSCDIARFR